MSYLYIKLGPKDSTRDRRIGLDLKGTRSWRKVITISLVTLGCLLATTAVAVVWLNRFVMDTDRYVETVAPLSGDPAIKDAVARSTTDALFAEVNAEELAREALPDRADFLAEPILGMLNGFVYGQVRDFLDSGEFENIWREANREAHEVMVNVLTGREGALQAQEGTVYLDLNVLLDRMKQRLAARGIPFFQDVTLEGEKSRFAIVRLPEITAAQRAVAFLNGLALWLPFVALAAWAGALWISRNRRLVILGAGLGLAIGMAALLLGLSAGRSSYVGAIRENGSVDLAAATSFFDIITATLKSSIRTAFALGLVVAAGAFLAGPAPPAVGARRLVARLYTAARETRARVDLGPAGKWIHSEKNLLMGAGAAVAMTALIIIGPSLLQAILIVAVLVIYLGAIEFIARKAA